MRVAASAAGWIVVYAGAAVTLLIARPVGILNVAVELNDVVSVAESVPVGYALVSAFTISAPLSSEAASLLL